MALSLETKQAKKITVDSFYGDGVVYNVGITSSINHKTSVYVPAVTYACDFVPGKKYCEGPLINKILSPVVGVVGLFLCYLAHRLWHLEVFVFTWVIFVLALYMCLSLIATASHIGRSCDDHVTITCA